MFRTTEVSFPEFESDNLRYITVKSKHLRGRGDICVFVPPIQNLEAIPLVILLHGVYGSSWVWSRKGGVHRTALELIQKGEISPMVIAMPSDGLWGDGSGYISHKNGNYEKWIAEDVPNAVIDNIASVNKTSKKFIGGLSMGGFGALRLGIKYSDTFSATSAHSSITHIDQMPLFVEEELHHYNEIEQNEASVYGIIKAHKGVLPDIRFDCGTEDILIEQNRQLHKQLVAEKIVHVYEEFSGGHEWPYWKEHIKDSLRFFNSKT